MGKQLDKKIISSWARLLKTHRLLVEQVEEHLKIANLPSLSWYDVLYELKCAEPKGLRQYEISQQALLNKHKLSRLLDRLQNKDLIQRNPCPEDGRGNRVRITEDGVQVLRNMWPIYSRAIRTHFSDQLETEEIQQLSEILLKLITKNRPNS